MLDRARRLDPLEPAYDVRKAVFLYDERSDPEAARDLLLDVVKLHPRYVPALARLCESNLLVGDIAEAVRRCEEALALDPLLEESRRFLIHQYLLLGEPDVAESLVESPGGEPSLRALPILIDRQDWRRAGEVAYRALERQTTSPTALAYACSAIRMHARVSGDYRRAALALDAESGISWDAGRNPVLPDEPARVRDPAIALADILLQSGDKRLGGSLLAAILSRMRHEIDARPSGILVRQLPRRRARNERRARRSDGDAGALDAAQRQAGHRVVATLRDRTRIRGAA